MEVHSSHFTYIHLSYAQTIDFTKWTARVEFSSPLTILADPRGVVQGTAAAARAQPKKKKRRYKVNAASPVGRDLLARPLDVSPGSRYRRRAAPIRISKLTWQQRKSELANDPASVPAQPSPAIRAQQDSLEISWKHPQLHLHLECCILSAPSPRPANRRPP